MAQLTGVYFVTNYLGHVGVPVGQSWRKRNHIFSASFGYSTNSPTPTPPPVGGGSIYMCFQAVWVKMSANISTKEITNVAVPRSFLPELQISFFLLLKGSQAHILTKDTQRHTPGTPRKSGFSDWKRPKEGERVARRHFHERVGESPRREKNFGTSGSKIPRFVSEI